MINTGLQYKLCTKIVVTIDNHEKEIVYGKTFRFENSPDNPMKHSGTNAMAVSLIFR